MSRNLMSRNLAVAAVITPLVLLAYDVSAWTKREVAHGKTIIAYYASWQYYDRQKLSVPASHNHSKVTRYNFAFFQIDVKGNIWGTDGFADPIVLLGEQDWSAAEGEGTVYCSWDSPGGVPACATRAYETGLISQAHSAGVEVYPSIGGWTLSNNFPKLAADPTARLNFANNCARMIEDYDFDGIDIDWEYPGYTDHMGTPEDTVNYSLFLKEIRTALDGLGLKTGRTYGLTAALPCGPNNIQNIQIDVISGILDELNLMTYDFHGTWDAKTNANAPLNDVDGSPEFSVHSCVETWMEGGGRADQINIGLPFYGRSFGGSDITGFGQEFDGKADLTWSEDEGSPQYFNIMSKIDGFTTVWDEQSQTAFAYSSTGLVSYDDERAICVKTEYVIDKDLNGYIIWEISGDLMPDLSTPLLDEVNGRLDDPTTRCDARHEARAAANRDNPVETEKKVGWIPSCPMFYIGNIAGPCCKSYAVCNIGVLVGSPIECMPGTIFNTIHDICDHEYNDVVCETGDDVDSDCDDDDTQSPTPRPISNVDPNHDEEYVEGAVFSPFPIVSKTQSPTPCPISNVDPNPLPISEFNPTLVDGELLLTHEVLPVGVDPTSAGNNFYPDYTSGGCRNDGNAPGWVIENTIKSSKIECCSTYFLSSFEHCINADSNPYYPNFQAGSCTNDGNHPKWMSGAYFAETKEICCKSSFHDRELQQHCYSLGM